MATVADVANLVRDGKIEEAMQLQLRTGYPLFQQVEGLVEQVVRIEEEGMARQREATVLVAVPDQPVGGHGAIAAGPDLTLPGGRLSSDELYTVKCSLQQPPRAHGFASDHWTLRRVAMVVERATGVRGWQPAELLGLLEALNLDLHLREQREQRDQPRQQGARRGARTTLVS